MIKNTLQALALLLFIAGCSSPQYLPKYREVGEAVYGGYIELALYNNQKLEGELIAVDSTQMIVMRHDSLNCIIVSNDSVKSFTLSYAQNEKYWASIPILTGIAASHGFIMVFTVPATALITSAATYNASKEYQFNEKQQRLAGLSLYARYPQGVPSNVALHQIMPPKEYYNK